MSPRLCDLVLALRLVRGSGARDWTRLAAMTVGVGFALFAALIGIAAPRVTAAAHDVLVARAPEWRETAEPGLQVRTGSALLAGQPWTQVSVSGTTPGAPLPPGLTAWPAAGTTIPSPALRAAAERDPAVAAMLGPLSETDVGWVGLTAPGELLSYANGALSGATAAKPGQRADAISVVGFGNDSAVRSSGTTGWLWIEVGLLIVFPAAMFLLTALRLSAVSRARRTFVLGLVGMSPRRVARLYANEMTAVAVAGFVLGAGSYSMLQAQIGARALLGVDWWPSQGRLGAPLTVAVGVLLVALVRGLARRSMARMAVRSRSELASPRGGLAPIAGLAALPALGFLAVIAWHGHQNPARGWASDRHAALIAGAVVLAVLAVVAATPGLIARSAQAIAGRTPGPVALGLRGAAHRINGARRLIAFLACAVMLCGLSAAFIQGLQRTAEGDSERATIVLDVADLPAQRDWMARLPDAPYIVETSFRGTDGVRYAVTIGDCPAVRRDAESFTPTPAPCTDTVQASGRPSATLRVAGRTVRLSGTPAPGMPWDFKVPVQAAPWLASLRSGQLTFLVSRTDDSYARVLSELSSAFPGLRVDAGLEDPDRYAIYLQQVATVRSAAVLGISLAVLAFLLATLEGRWQRSRSVATLAALGTSRRALRLANTVEFTFPVLIAAVPAAVVAILGGWSVLSFWGTDQMFSGQVPLWSLTGLAIAVCAAAGAGWVTGHGVFDREAISDT